MQAAARTGDRGTLMTTLMWCVIILFLSHFVPRVLKQVSRREWGQSGSLDDDEEIDTFVDGGDF